MVSISDKTDLKENVELTDGFGVQVYRLVKVLEPEFDIALLLYSLGTLYWVIWWFWYFQRRRLFPHRLLR